MLESYFDSRGNEIIPAVPWPDRPPRPDPTARDRVALTSDCKRLRDRTMYSRFKKKAMELEIEVYDGNIFKEQFNKLLTEVRKRFGEENVRSILVLVLNDDGFGEPEPTISLARLGINGFVADRKVALIRQLQAQGYERDLGSETGLFMAFRLSPARQWK